MRSLDIFSCIGCHAIGFARAGIDTIAFCESNAYRRGELAKSFQAPIHDDVRTLAAPRAGILIGGPPCQRTSVAAAIHGKRDGESLWPHMLRIGIDACAEWIVVEQPPGHATWEAEVCRDLSDAGYHVARVEFGACDVGAPYLRRRVFLVACADLPRLEIAWSAVPSEIDRVKRTADARGDWDPDKLATLQVDARSARERGILRKEMIEALGDSNPPHMAEVIGRAIVRGNSLTSNPR